MDNLPPDSEQNQPNEGRPWIMIAINSDGSMKVSGFTNDKIIAYGLLASAKDLIKDHTDKLSKIERVNNSGGLIHSLRNGFKR